MSNSVKFNLALSSTKILCFLTFCLWLNFISKTLESSSYKKVFATNISKYKTTKSIENDNFNKSTDNFILKLLEDDKDLTIKEIVFEMLRSKKDEKQIVDEYFKLPDEFKSLLIYNSKIYEKDVIKKRDTVSKNKNESKEILKIEDEIVNSEKNYIAKKIMPKVIPNVKKNTIYIILSPGHGPGPYGLDGGCFYNKTKESELNEALVYEKVVELLKRTKNIHINLCYPPQNIFTKQKFETDKRLTKEDLKKFTVHLTKSTLSCQLTALLINKTINMLEEKLTVIMKYIKHLQKELKN